MGAWLLTIVLAGAQPPPVATIQIESFILTNGIFRLHSRSSPDSVHSLQVSGNLVDWKLVDFIAAPLGEAELADASASNASLRFYRVSLNAPATIWATNYHGWSDSLVIGNGLVEVVIVPAVQRVMQFRFASEDDGPFWENRLMDGKVPAANSWDTTGSFGGDKIWPAPQSLWNWPPPRAFDSLTASAKFTNGVITLTSPVDSALGIRLLRRIQLHPTESVLRIESMFEKVSGANRSLSIWVVTQLKSPERVFMPVPVPSIFPNGYTLLGEGLPKNLQTTNGLLSFTRDESAARKIGNDAGQLLWVGPTTALLMESPRVTGATRSQYPDNGSSAEVYTNPNPVAYVELELLSPLRQMKVGETSQATCTYTLFPRTELTPFAEATRIFEK